MVKITSPAYHSWPILGLVVLAQVLGLGQGFAQGFAQASPPRQPLWVFAASSLQPAFTAIQASFEPGCGCRLEMQFAGSQVLAAQINAGARADVFASASPELLAPLAAQGLFAKPQGFASNRLVVAVFRRPNPTITRLADLAKPGIKLVMAQASVPVGDQTQRFLRWSSTAAGFGPKYRQAVLGNVVSEETNVRQVLLKVQLGEADAGFVYASDVVSTPNGVYALALPNAWPERASYAVAWSSTGPKQAKAFVEFLQSSRGRAILRRWGLTVP
jgi:molybdate transport system substrate-binding protein